MQGLEHYDNCVFHSCTLEEYNTTVCEHAASTATFCQDAYGVNVAWMTTDFCRMFYKGIKTNTFYTIFGYICKE